MLILDKQSQADVISTFNDTSRYLDIENPFFDNMVPIIYPKELKLNKANTSNTSATFIDLDLSIDN